MLVYAISSWVKMQGIRNKRFLFYYCFIEEQI